MLRQALAYASRGWPVFPCQPDQKIPATRHGYRDATTDQERITAWFSRGPSWNPAIATEAARLMEYCVARGTDLGPIGLNFGRTCDEIDRADVMLADLRGRVQQRQGLPEPTWPDTDGPHVVALAHRNPRNRTVSLVMDATTANITMFAVSAYAGDREAHVREVEQYGEKLPEDSYGRRNRQAIAAREARVAARLRAIEHAYRIAIEHGAALEHEPARTIRPADHEMELE
jgi:Bifunctional DNA primase/polymerase, N-terminal